MITTPLIPLIIYDGRRCYVQFDHNKRIELRIEYSSKALIKEINTFNLQYTQPSLDCLIHGHKQYKEFQQVQFN